MSFKQRDKSFVWVALLVPDMCFFKEQIYSPQKEKRANLFKITQSQNLYDA